MLSRDVDMGEGRKVQSPPLPPSSGAIFALEYLKKGGGFRQKWAKMVNPPPPLREKVKIRTLPRGGCIYVLVQRAL